MAMDNTVPLRDQLASLEGVVHWEEGEVGAMTFKEERWYALYKIWEQLNRGVAEQWTWTFGSTGGRSGGGVSGTGC